MKTISIGGMKASEISLGCMRISGLEGKDAVALLECALREGVNFFDHADIYGGGRSEEVFAQAVADMGLPRESLLIQSKCGIRNGMFDFSREHILEAVEGSLKRLRTDYLDALLLHRPDTLMEPDEIAEAFQTLQAQGKVRAFGVSNCNPMQMELIGSGLPQKLLINQLQLSLTNTGMIDSGLNVNMKIDHSIDRDGSILEYCRLKGVTIQPWSPFQYGFFEGAFLGSPKFQPLNSRIDELASEFGVQPEAIAIAWLLRHPARMQPVVGTTNPARLAAICGASQVTLSREQWYSLYLAAGNQLP